MRCIATWLAIVRAGDATRYAEANDAFHTAIYEGAHNGYLCEITHLDPATAAAVPAGAVRGDGAPGSNRTPSTG